MFLNVKQASKLVKCSTRYIRYLIADHKLKVCYVGSRVKFHILDIMAYTMFKAFSYSHLTDIQQEEIKLYIQDYSITTD